MRLIRRYLRCNEVKLLSNRFCNLNQLSHSVMNVGIFSNVYAYLRMLYLDFRELESYVLGVVSGDPCRS